VNGNTVGVDQVGRNRPIDGDGNESSLCDPGAYEHNSADFGE